MIYASACFNPIIYVIMNKQYRKAFKSVLNYGCCEKATKRVPVLRSISKRLQPHGNLTSSTVMQTLQTISPG